MQNFDLTRRNYPNRRSLALLPIEDRLANRGLRVLSECLLPHVHDQHSKLQQMMRWIFLGDYAGEDAEQIAPVDILEELTEGWGTFHVAVEHLIDTLRDYFCEKLTGDMKITVRKLN